MRKWMWMVMGVALLLLTACSPMTTGQAETAATSAAQPTDGAPALAPAPSSVPAAAADEAIEAIAVDEWGADAAGGGNDPATPVSAELPAALPVATTGTESQEAPAPGRPQLTRRPQSGLLLEAALVHLSDRLAVPASAVAVVDVQQVTWPNTGLGCEEEGVAYAEVMVEGSQITLEAGGERYTYHTAASGEYVLCADGTPAASGVVPQR